MSSYPQDDEFPRDPAASVDGLHIDAPAADLEAIIAEQLPGWRLVRKQASVTDNSRPAVVPVRPGPSLAELRRKFLPPDEVGQDAAASAALEPGSRQTHRVSVLVEPEGGGTAKVADVVDGKVKMVQG